MRQPRSTGPRRFARRLRRRVARATRGRLGPSQLGPVRIGPLTLGPVTLGSVSLGRAGSSPWLRRGVLVAALLGVAFMPYSSSGGPAVASQAGCHAGCHTGEQNMLRWTRPLPGSWNVLPGLSGTVPVSGLAYTAAGNGVVALGAGMTVYAYAASTGRPLWQDPLAGFPAGTAIVSVRIWPGEVTVGVSYQNRRTEVVIATSTGVVTGEYPAARFGGAVAGSAKFTVIVGNTAVTSYDNATRHVRWQRSTGQVTQGWQTDGKYLYVAESVGGILGSAPVTAVRRIDTGTGTPQQILPAEPIDGALYQGAAAFSGTLAAAFRGVLLFSAASGVTAYSGTTGERLWSMAGAVPEGADPQQGRFYLTRGSSLVAVSPLTGRIRATAPIGGLYAVRGGVALGLDPGADGDAWGYSLAAQRVAITVPALAWPHYFVDVSGIGGSADLGSDLVVIATCAKVGPAVSAQPSPTTSFGLSSPPASPSSSATSSPPASSSPSVSPSPSPTTSPAAPAPQACLLPRLVALSL